MFSQTSMALSPKESDINIRQNARKTYIIILLRNNAGEELERNNKTDNSLIFYYLSEIERLLTVGKGSPTG